MWSETFTVIINAGIVQCILYGFCGPRQSLITLYSDPEKISKVSDVDPAQTAQYLIEYEKLIRELGGNNGKNQ